MGTYILFQRVYTYLMDDDIYVLVETDDIDFTLLRRAVEEITLELKILDSFDDVIQT